MSLKEGEIVQSLGPARRYSVVFNIPGPKWQFGLPELLSVILMLLIWIRHHFWEVIPPTIDIS